MSLVAHAKNLGITTLCNEASPFSVKMCSFYCRAIKEAFPNLMEEPVPKSSLVSIATVIFDSSINLQYTLFLIGNPELNPTVRQKNKWVVAILKTSMQKDYLAIWPLFCI